MKTPSIPPGVIVAIVGAVAALLAAFGIPMSVEKQKAIEQAVEILAPVVIAATVYLHGVRAKNVESIMKAKAVQAAADVKSAQAKVDAAAEAAPSPAPIPA